MHIPPDHTSSPEVNHHSADGPPKEKSGTPAAKIDKRPALHEVVHSCAGPTEDMAQFAAEAASEAFGEESVPIMSKDGGGKWRQSTALFARSNAFAAQVRGVVRKRTGEIVELADRATDVADPLRRARIDGALEFIAHLCAIANQAAMASVPQIQEALAAVLFEIDHPSTASYGRNIPKYAADFFTSEKRFWRLRDRNSNWKTRLTLAPTHGAAGGPPRKGSLAQLVRAIAEAGGMRHKAIVALHAELNLSRRTLNRMLGEAIEAGLLVQIEGVYHVAPRPALKEAA